MKRHRTNLLKGGKSKWIQRLEVNCTFCKFSRNCILDFYWHYSHALRTFSPHIFADFLKKIADSLQISQESLMNHPDDVFNQIDRTVDLNDSCNNLHSALDSEAKISFGHLSPGRLSPNLFLNLNLDNLGERKAIDIDWSTYSDTIPTTSCTITLPNTQPHLELCLSSVGATVPYTITNQNPYIRSTSSMDMSNYLNLDTSTTSASYDEIKYIGVDSFTNLDGFKSDCMFGMSDSVCLNDRDIEVTDALVKETHVDLDIHETFEMHESMEKSMPLLDLEKPIININVDSSAFSIQHSEN